MPVCSDADTKQGQTVSSHVRGTVYTPAHWATKPRHPFQSSACAERFGRDPPLGLFIRPRRGFLLWLLDLRSCGSCQQATVWQTPTWITLWKWKCWQQRVPVWRLQTKKKDGEINLIKGSCCSKSTEDESATFLFLFFLPIKSSALVCVSRMTSGYISCIHFAKIMITWADEVNINNLQICPGW